MIKYVITDPCYILEDEWDMICKRVKDEQLTFVDATTEVLTAFTGKKAYVADTGYGDWTNSVDGQRDLIEAAEFCADAGMVCLCELTDKVKERLFPEQNDANFGLAAIINCAEGPLRVTIDTSNPEWTQLRITDSAGNYFETTSAEYDE